MIAGQVPASAFADPTATTFRSLTDRLLYAGARMLAQANPPETERAALNQALAYLTDPDFQEAVGVTITSEPEEQKVRAIYAAATLAVWAENHPASDG